MGSYRWVSPYYSYVQGKSDNLGLLEFDSYGVTAGSAISPPISKSSFLNLPGSLSIAPCSAGKSAPLGGLFLDLKSSQMSSIFTHSTPSFVLIYSINLKPRAYQFVSGFASNPHKLAVRGVNEGDQGLPLQHEDNMWMPAHIRVDGHREAEVVVLAVEIIKVVPPEFFDVFWVHPAVRVRCFLDEHHRWEI